MAEPVIVGGVVLGAVFLLTTAFRHGHRHGEIAGMAKALRILEDHRQPSPVASLHFSVPSDATPAVAFAWSADFLEQGGEYAGGQHAFRRARFGASAPRTKSQGPSEAQIAEAVNRSVEGRPHPSSYLD